MGPATSITNNFTPLSTRLSRIGPGPRKGPVILTLHPSSFSSIQQAAGEQATLGSRTKRLRHSSVELRPWGRGYQSPRLPSTRPLFSSLSLSLSVSCTFAFLCGSLWPIDRTLLFRRVPQTFATSAQYTNGEQASPRSHPRPPSTSVASARQTSSPSPLRIGLVGQRGFNWFARRGQAARSGTVGSLPTRL